jgi:hypothetical protein
MNPDTYDSAVAPIDRQGRIDADVMCFNRQIM